MRTSPPDPRQGYAPGPRCGTAIRRPVILHLSASDQNFCRKALVTGHVSQWWLNVDGQCSLCHYTGPGIDYILVEPASNLPTLQQIIERRCRGEISV
jgi:hypothetical protein